MRRTLVLWDIDGTLLTTLKAGIGAWEDAARAVLGAEMDLETMRTSGLTDPMIAREILAMVGQAPDSELEEKLGTAYVAALPERLTERQGFALPGVTGVLEALIGCDGTAIGLCTGNYHRGAVAKLERYGLGHYFQFGGFGDDGFDRTEIGRAALRRARAFMPNLDSDRVFLVGDSPYDIECAHALAVRAIAVATGVHSTAELGRDEPWWLLDRLPSPDAFLDRIGSGRG